MKSIYPPDETGYLKTKNKPQSNEIDIHTRIANMSEYAYWVFDSLRNNKVLDCERRAFKKVFEEAIYRVKDSKHYFYCEGQEDR
jgi:hypothetical protein